MHNPFFIIFRRDVKLAFCQGGQALHIFAFYAVVVVLFVLAIGSEPQKLQEMAASILWVTALLALTLGFPAFFQHDYEDGGLEQLLLLPLPLEWVVLAKCLAGWVANALPLVVASPILALMLHMSPETIKPLMVSLLLGTACITFIGALGAALVLGNNRAGVLLSLLTMPLFIPPLIFGSSAISNIAQEPALSFTAFKILVAILLGVAPVSCFVSAILIREAVK